MARSRVADEGYGLQMWRVAVIHRKNRRGQPIRGGLSAGVLGDGLKTPLHKKKTACYEMMDRVSELTGSYEHGNEP
jgi:hypothetical protein